MPSYDAILECTRKFLIGKHRYKVPCAHQDGVIARKKISDVFLQPKHIEVSLLVWYLFCGCSFLFCGQRAYTVVAFSKLFPVRSKVVYNLSFFFPIKHRYFTTYSKQSKADLLQVKIFFQP